MKERVKKESPDTTVSKKIPFNEQAKGLICFCLDATTYHYYDITMIGWWESHYSGAIGLSLPLSF